MKRTHLVRKTALRSTKTLKRSSNLRKKSKEPISRIQRKLWELCKKITRKRYGNSCYTCSATNLVGSNQQTGHMWAKASLGALLKYDLRVLRIQCARCNLFLGGQGALFYARMLKEIGIDNMSELESDRNKLVRAYDHYVATYLEYQKILEELEGGDKTVLQIKH